MGVEKGGKKMTDSIWICVGVYGECEVNTGINYKQAARADEGDEPRSVRPSTVKPN